MKLLLLFTLLSFACYGQSDTIDAGYFMSYPPSANWNGISTFIGVGAIDSAVKIYNAKFRNDILEKELSLEEKLLLYTQECWNDSTLKEFIEDVPPSNYSSGYEKYGSPLGFVVGHRRRTYTKWVHRKPTFEGFVEWLRKQK